MESGFFEKALETASQDELHAMQSERLRQVVRNVYASNDLFRARFNERGIAPDDIHSLNDVTKLPLMDKDLFRLAYPLKLNCVPVRQIVEMHMSSGSTGTPVVMPYTDSDLHQWGQCMARCYCMAGAEKGDVVQITPSFGLFNGGFGMYHGAREAGLFIVPAGAGNTPRQIRLANDFGARILTGVVSYGVRIMEVLQEAGEKLDTVKIGIFGAETFSDSMKKKLAAGLGAEVFDIYGMTETGGVGTLGMDCKAHDGTHVWEDHYIVEILEAGSEKAVPDGQEGELVVTSLTRQALPVIRFRTGDLTRIHSRKRCACGRTHVRIAPITGRVDDMLIFKGVNFFPKQVEQALMQIPGVGSNYQILVDDTDGIREVTVNVEAEPQVTGYTVEKVLKETLGFSPKGDVFPIGKLARQEGKAKRVFFVSKGGIK